MRLLHFDSARRLTSTDFSGKTIPSYAILSHTWGSDEFLFEDLVNGTGENKAGYKKILFCREQAARDHLQYFWIDTCCIDKWNLRELSNAINSMFRWYRNAAKCYVYLSDVSIPVTKAPRSWMLLERITSAIVRSPQYQSTWDASFQKSRWFTRGWTLQELIAPASVEFFSLEHQRLGDKESLEQQIHEITRIPVEALRGDSLNDFSINDRMSWMKGRETEREEDIVYSLIGIFGMSMEFRYGEGKERASTRLQEEMEKANTTPFIVPFDRNPRFVGRESQLAELEGKLFIGSLTTKVAILGPGGIGKTQLALELVYRIREEFKNCLVFWISISDIESLHRAYTHIAQRLNIPGWDNEKVDAKKLVCLYLSKESIGHWLLVFDITDEAILEGAGSPQTVGLIEYLPESNRGTIVFTTTNRKTAATLALQGIVELTEMEQDKAQRMLELCLISQVNDQEAANLLLKELAYLPLAIVQAAAYVNVNKITLRQYLLLLAKYKKEVVEPVSKECENAIATTWRISFEQIRQDALAADYLFFMACVDPTDIPLALLPTISPREKEIDIVGTLDAYSFVTRRVAESALDLHRLVHLATRTWLRDQELLSQRTQVAITRLLKVFPNASHWNRSKWRRLLPHAKFVLSSLPGQKNEARTNLVHKYAMALLSDGRFNEAGAYFNDALLSWKEALGIEHPSTLTSMANLASTYRDQGRWKEAEDLFIQVIETRKRVLGTDHPSTLTGMANLASTFGNQGRWKEAEVMFIQVMETFRRVLGAEHPSTLTSMGLLASTYRNQGRWKEAEDLEVQVIETRKRVLGAEHLDTLTSVVDLALIYKNQGRWNEAKDLEVQVMETRKRVLGAEHPDTLTSMANLASTYRIRGCWKEAEDLEVQAMETFKRVLGAEHPDTLTSISNLALTYRNQGRWKEAEDMVIQVMETFKRVLGAEHRSTLTSIANLASIFWNQGRWSEAEDLEVQVMETRKRVLGAEHPDTLTTMNNFAFTLKGLGRYKEAVRLMRQSTEARARILGPNHPHVLSSSTKLLEWEAEKLEVSTSNNGD